MHGVLMHPVVVVVVSPSWLHVMVLCLLLTQVNTNELPWLHCWQPKLERAVPCNIISDNAAMFERKRFQMIKLALGLMTRDNAAGDG